MQGGLGIGLSPVRTAVGSMESEARSEIGKAGVGVAEAVDAEVHTVHE